MTIHRVYAELSEDDREKIDSLYDTVALHMRTDGEHPDGGDDAEHLVEALAVYLVASRKRYEEREDTRHRLQLMQIQEGKEGA